VEKDRFIEEQIGHLDEILAMRDRIADLDASLREAHPVAAVESGAFYVFDIDPRTGRYHFIMEHPTPTPIPDGVLAAFPLDFYHGKAAAVIDAKHLPDPDRRVMVFHEFVHCHQWNTCERDLRERLSVEKQQMNVNNYMWELNYPFPYADEFFVRETAILNEMPDDGARRRYAEYHARMKARLSETDYEYMVWQEWKEGYARYVENKIRKRLNGDVSRDDMTPPYDRVTFYETGSRYIGLLLETDAAMGLEELFRAMMNPGEVL